MLPAALALFALWSLLVTTGVAAIAAATKGANVCDGLKVTTGAAQGRTIVAGPMPLPVTSCEGVVVVKMAGYGSVATVVLFAGSGLVTNVKAAPGVKPGNKSNRKI